MEHVYKRKDFIVKLFACLLIAVFLFFTFIGSRVFASTETFSVNNMPLIIDFDNKTATFNGESVFTDSNIWNYNMTFILIDNIDLRILLYDGELSYYNSNFHYENEFYYHTQRYNNSGFCYLFPRNLSDFTLSSNSLNQYSGNLDYAIFTTADIKDKDGNVVFQAPPQEQDKVLAPIVEGEEIKPLQEILQILPIVMIVVVGYLALRKGLAILFRFLRIS